MEKKLIPLLKGGKWGDVLDVGSKDARYKQFMDYSSYDSLDIDSTYRPDIVADIEWYESNKKYDTILLTQVLEHVKNPDIAIKRCHELLKDGGRLIVSTPFIFQEHGMDYWRWTEEGLRLLFNRYFAQGKVGIVGYGNFLTSSWDIFHFHNRFSLLNPLIALVGSWLFSSHHCPSGFITIANR